MSLKLRELYEARVLYEGFDVLDASGEADL